MKIIKFNRVIFAREKDRSRGFARLPISSLTLFAKKQLLEKSFAMFSRWTLVARNNIYLDSRIALNCLDSGSPANRGTAAIGDAESSTYRRPQGSFSAIVSTSLAILGSKSAGRRTSPQASWACLALLSSTSSLFASAWQAPSNSSVSLPAVTIN